MVEFLEGHLQMYKDPNDGESGFGSLGDCSYMFLIVFVGLVDQVICVCVFCLAFLKFQSHLKKSSVGGVILNQSKGRVHLHFFLCITIS